MMAEYHVGCGAFGIYAGTLNKKKDRWQNKSEVTEEATHAVVQHVKQEMMLDKKSTRTDEFTFIDGSVMRVTYEVLKGE
jgi:hypothetical protein